MKRHVCFVMAIMMALLAAPGGFAETGMLDENGRIKLDYKGTLVYFEPHLSNEAEAAGIRKNVEAFEAMYPGIEIELEYVPVADRTTKFIALMAAGVGPDIVCVGNNSDYKSFAEAGYLVKMDPLIQQVYGDTQAYWDRFMDSSLTYLRGLTPDGDMYGIPYYQGGYAVVYNKKMYEEAGIDVLPTTWAEFEQAMKKLTVDKDGDGIIDQYGLMIPSKRETAYRTFYMSIWGNGGDVVDEGGNIVVNSPQNIETLTYLTDLVNSGCVPPGIGEVDYDVYMQAFANGECATIIEQNGTPTAIGVMNPQMVGNIGAYSLPVRDESCTPRPTGFASNYCISTDCADPLAAFAFIDYVTTLEGQMTSFSGGYGPVTLEAIDVLQNDPVVGDFIKDFPAVRLQPVFKNTVEAQDAINACMQQAFLKVRTPEQALDELANNLERIFSK